MYMAIQMYISVIGVSPVSDWIMTENTGVFSVFYRFPFLYPDKGSGDDADNKGSRHFQETEKSAKGSYSY